MAADSSTVEVPEHVLSYLAEQPTLTLATATPRGIPRATTFGYVNDGLVLYIWTHPGTTTAQHIEENPAVAFATADREAEWSASRGVQGSGRAHAVLDEDELEKAVGLFEQKYPQLADTLGRGVSIFRIVVTDLSFIGTPTADSSAGGMSYPRDDVYSIFRDLPPEQLESVATTLQAIQVDAGDVIVRQGSPADRFFIVVEGEVEVVQDVGGEPRRVATLSNGQFFGEMAILRDTPRSATVRATMPTTIFAMERDAFRSVVAQSLGTTEDFDRVIQQRLAEIPGD